MTLFDTILRDTFYARHLETNICKTLTLASEVHYLGGMCVCVCVHVLLAQIVWKYSETNIRKICHLNFLGSKLIRP